MTSVIDVASGLGLEATLNTSESQSVEALFEFNRLKSIQNMETISTTLQVIKDGRLGVASSTKPDVGEELLQKAIALSAYGSPVSYHLPEVEKAASPVLYSKETADFPLESMLRIGEELAAFMKSLHSDVNGTVQVYRATSRHSISNTKGLDASWRKSQFEIGVGLNLAEGQNMVQVGDYVVSPAPHYDLADMKNRIKQDFDLARRNVPLESGAYDVVFTWNAFRDLILPLVECLNGKAVVRGESPFANRLGEQAFSPKFTVVEDGAREMAVASRIYDLQGVACRRTPLVNAGVLSEYILDLETAAKLVRKPTGTGGAGGPTHNNIVIEPGDLEKDEMVAGLKKGIIIDMTMGSWAGNPYSGQVTGNIALGYLVEDGKPVGRVKDSMFSLNIFKHLKDSLVALSKESKCIGNIFLPYALLKDVSVSAKKE
ncbi:MAG: TldD/PmbA family protein [Bacillota bacterium]